MGDPLQNLTDGGILGWVCDRDAQHRLLTQIVTKGQNGVEAIPDLKKGVKMAEHM